MKTSLPGILHNQVKPSDALYTLSVNYCTHPGHPCCSVCDIEDRVMVVSTATSTNWLSALTVWHSVPPLAHNVSQLYLIKTADTGPDLVTSLLLCKQVSVVDGCSCREQKLHQNASGARFAVHSIHSPCSAHPPTYPSLVCVSSPQKNSRSQRKMAVPLRCLDKIYLPDVGLHFPPPREDPWTADAVINSGLT